jgi:hypothetical protein
MLVKSNNHFYDGGMKRLLIIGITATITLIVLIGIQLIFDYREAYDAGVYFPMLFIIGLVFGLVVSHNFHLDVWYAVVAGHLSYNYGFLLYFQGGEISNLEPLATLFAIVVSLISGLGASFGKSIRRRFIKQPHLSPN